MFDIIRHRTVPVMQPKNPLIATSSYADTNFYIFNQLYKFQEKHIYCISDYTEKKSTVNMIKPLNKNKDKS